MESYTVRNTLRTRFTTSEKCLVFFRALRPQKQTLQWELVVLFYEQSKTTRSASLRL